MQATNPYAQKRTDSQTTQRTTRGPTHNPLGTDEEGASHHWNRDTQTIFVINDGQIEHRENLNAHAEKDVADWVDYVNEERGWQHCTFIKLSARDLEPIGGRY